MVLNQMKPVQPSQIHTQPSCNNCVDNSFHTWQLQVVPRFDVSESFVPRSALVDTHTLGTMLGRINSVKHLNLQHCSSVGPDALAHVGKLRHVHELNLGGCSITDDTLEHLLPLQQLAVRHTVVLYAFFQNGARQKS